MSPTRQRAGCPICRTALAGLHSELIAEARCPRCEADLWALALNAGPVFLVRRPGQSAAEFINALTVLALSESDIVSSLRGADSLDLIEFTVEIEAAWKEHNRRQEDPMYDPQLDESLWP